MIELRWVLIGGNQTLQYRQMVVGRVKGGDDTLFTNGEWFDWEDVPIMFEKEAAEADAAETKP